MTTPAGGARGTLRQRVRARLVGAAARLLIVLPERPVNALGDAVGEVWYRSAPARVARARRNFRRVAEHLVRRGLGGARIRAAATDDRALEAVVRSAFRHAVRYYLDMARLPGKGIADIERNLIVETPEAVEEAFGVPGPLLFVAMHFGAVEYPALYGVARTGRRVTAPMETLGDPALHAWIARTRSSVGVDIVTLREARRALTDALARGETVGLVADRNVAGGTVDVPFFGVAAPLPMGPGLLAVEHGLPDLGRRRAPGAGRPLPRSAPAGRRPGRGTRRARIVAAMTGAGRGDGGGHRRGAGTVVVGASRRSGRTWIRRLGREPAGSSPRPRR